MVTQVDFDNFRNDMMKMMEKLTEEVKLLKKEVKEKDKLIRKQARMIKDPLKEIEKEKKKIEREKQKEIKKIENKLSRRDNKVSKLIERVKEEKNEVKKEKKEKRQVIRNINREIKVVKEDVKKKDKVIKKKVRELNKTKNERDIKAIQLRQTHKRGRPLGSKNVKKKGIESVETIFEDERDVKLIDRAIEDNVEVYDTGVINEDNPLMELKMSMKGIKKTIKDELKKHKGVKFIRSLFISFKNEKQKEDGEHDYLSKEIESNPYIVMREDQIDDVLNEVFNDIKEKIENMTTQGSGWTVDKIKDTYIKFYKYDPLGGTSYFETPRRLINKSLINIKNEDQRCFLYCHLFHTFKDKIKRDPQRVSKYKKYFTENGELYDKKQCKLCKETYLDEDGETVKFKTIS